MFPAVELYPGRSISIHTGRGKDNDTNLYWNRKSAVWNDEGDLAVLIDDRGAIRTCTFLG